MNFHKNEFGVAPVAASAVFVFGTNDAGLHLGGAAHAAYLYHKAKWSVGRGPTGSAYAIACRNKDQHRLPLDEVAQQVEVLKSYAANQPFKTFYVTRIGCENGDFTDSEIAALFKDCSQNFNLPDAWKPFLD